jgi:hypothetical protein
MCLWYLEEPASEYVLDDQIRRRYHCLSVGRSYVYLIRSRDRTSTTMQIAIPQMPYQGM